MDEEHRTRSDSGAVARDEDLVPTYTDKDGVTHQKRILTGDRTTGKLHLGHYVGSLRNRVKYQGAYDTFILMADVQALTTHWDRPEVLKQSVRDVALDYMAVGLDPYTGGADDGCKAKIVVQSHVPAIAELTVLYGLVVPMSLIMDNPTTKAEAEQYGMDLPASEDQPLNTEAASKFQGIAQEHVSSIVNTLTAEYPELGELDPEAIVAGLNSANRELTVSHRKELQDHGFPSSFSEIPIDSMHLVLVDSAALRRHLRDHIIRYKRSAGIRQMSYGFLGYPVSQAADITFVNAHLVPVGDDQVPHIELTREIVRRMNKQYGKRQRILTVPQALLGGSTIKGLDGGAKMSKSLGNAVYLSDSDEEIWDKVRKAVTDPQRIKRDDPGRPEICNIYDYHRQFNEDTEPAIKDAGLNVPTVEETAELCRSAGIGCVECKKNLAAKLSALLNPMRERRAAWEKRESDLMDVLKEGTRRGNEEGNETVERVKAAMHVDYWK
jgi:tryptophanyl-tRNA synthetase